MNPKLLAVAMLVAGISLTNVAAFAGANDYAFEPVAPEMKKGDDVIVAVRAATCAAALSSAEDGRSWLRPFWDDIADLQTEERGALGEALVPVVIGIGPDWLARLESAVKRFPRDKQLVYAFGHVLVERQLWGRARLMLEQVRDDRSLSLVARRRSWLTLARLAEQDGDLERRASCHRAAAMLQ